MSRLRAAARRAAPEPLVRAVRRRRGGGPGRAPVAPAPRGGGARRAPLRYVFVVTYGRSGSTLIQGLLNAMPRTLVRGENNFYLLHLYRAWADVRAFRDRHGRHNPRAEHSAFYGLHEIRPGSLVRSTRRLVTAHLLGSTGPDRLDVLGFKEVAWFRLEEAEVADFFDFLERCFPGSRYVLNQRDHAQVLGSGFWQDREREEVVSAIRQVEAIQDFLRTSRPERTLDVHYEQVTSDDPEVSGGQLRALADFVTGRTDEATLAAMRDTLATGHGPHPFGVSRGRQERRRR